MESLLLSHLTKPELNNQQYLQFQPLPGGGILNHQSINSQSILRRHLHDKTPTP